MPHARQCPGTAPSDGSRALANTTRNGTQIAPRTSARLVDCTVVTPAPLLSMLWEPVDPADALTKRFRFDDAVAAVAWMAEALWDAWAIAVDGCDRLVIERGERAGLDHDR